MATDKGERLHALKRAKAATVRRIKEVRSRWGSPKSKAEWDAAMLSPRQIGRTTSQHGTCGCSMCQADRFDGKHSPKLYKGNYSGD